MLDEFYSFKRATLENSVRFDKQDRKMTNMQKTLDNITLLVSGYGDKCPMEKAYIKQQHKRKATMSIRETLEVAPSIVINHPS